VRQQAITSSFRSTIRHLQSKAGFAARFRGLSLYVVYYVTFSLVTGIISAVPLIPRAVAPVLSAVLLANLILAWTHIVISDPSPKRWYQRLPASRVWKKVAGPTAILAIAEQLTVLLPVALAKVYGLDMDPKTAANLSGAEKHKAAWKGFSVFILCIVMGFLLVIPANVALTRVQASLLEDDQETIVPFDRSFGGKVIPEIVGGSGVIGILDAWKTFDWNARVRLVKAYVKVFAMQMALTMLFMGVVVAQLFIIIGKSDLKKIINDPKNGDDDVMIM
jgi:hypothetical protein